MAAPRPSGASASESFPGKSRWRARTEYDYLLKLVIVGDEGTGKSALMNRFCDDMFSDSYVATIGVDFKVRTVIVNSGDVTSTVKMQMWDTAGQERFSSITSSFYRGADAVLCLYDITSRISFQRIHKWFKGCTNVCGDTVSGFLIGNKCDLERYREVDKAEGQAMAEKLGLPHFETSAKNSTNVDAAFRHIAEQYAAVCRAKQQSLKGLQQKARAQRKAPKPSPPGAEPGCWSWLKQIFSWGRKTSTSSGELRVVAAPSKAAAPKEPAGEGLRQPCKAYSGL